MRKKNILTNMKINFLGNGFENLTILTQDNKLIIMANKIGVSFSTTKSNEFR